MIKRLFSYLVVALLIGTTAQAQISPYNVVWDTPSQNSAGSMPCGGGDVGLNVWAEDGDLLFYIGRSGTFDENNALLKLGRVRLTLTPNPLADTTAFRQELLLEDGYVKITAGRGAMATEIRVWVDVFRPVIHLEVDSKSKLTAEARYETWRYRDRPTRGSENNQNSYKWSAPRNLVTRADSIRYDGDGVLFYHANRATTVFDVVVTQQGLDEVKDQMMNPLKSLTFGGILTGQGMKPAGTGEGKYLDTDFCWWALRSEKPAASHRIEVVLHTAQATFPAWSTGLEQARKEAARWKKPHEPSLAWWHAFWQRSFIVIDPGRGATDQAWRVGRNYQLFRYMLGCNAYGDWPTKFNGGLFTYDPVFTNEKMPYSPDFRNWGGGTMTAQNQRLVYWPMLKSGDWEIMLPQFDFYDRALRNAELRTKVYWGHAGASFTEQIENYSLPNPAEYGFDRPEGWNPGVEYNAWLEYQWDSVLEFCLMILEAGRYKGDAAIGGVDIHRYLPLIESCLTFFDEHYQYLARQRGRRELDGAGHLVLFPGSAAETYKMAYNATSTVAALQTVTRHLLELDGFMNEERQDRWSEFLKRIPPLNYREIDGRRMLSPAVVWERVNNTEVPQLYPVFPWRIYGVGRPDLETAINTYLYDPDAQKFRAHYGWKQDNIWAACLGLTDEAKRLVLLKMDDAAPRFPAFWGPGFDWTPDHNHGGSAMIGLQEMLLQEDGDGKLILFPSWPADWDVHFKLRAPGQTTVEAELRDGKIQSLTVTPASRRADIVLPKTFEN